MAKVSGSGSVVQLEKDKTRGKCRRWQLRVSVGMDPRTGKYRTRTRRVEGTYTQARAALREFIDELEGDRAQGKTSYTVEEYCKRYVDRRERNKELATTTISKLRYECAAVCSHIGKANIASVTTLMVNDMYSAMLSGQNASGTALSGSYVHHIHVSVSAIFSQAVDEGLIVSNPFDKASPPRVDTGERRAVAPDEVASFVAALDPSKERDCAYLLAVTTGMRRGEICGLSWGDVDFDEGTISVSHSFNIFGELKSPKTAAGKRLLPMTAGVAEALRTHKEAQAARYRRLNAARKKRGEGQEELSDQEGHSAVITGRTGQRINPTTLTAWWGRERRRFGLDGVTLHELRHTYLSLLALNGVHPKVMQELAGHSSPTVTMKIYTHVNLDAKRDAVQKLESLF